MFRLFNVSSILNHDIITCLIIVVVVVVFLNVLIINPEVIAHAQFSQIIACSLLVTRTQLAECLHVCLINIIFHILILMLIESTTIIIFLDGIIRLLIMHMFLIICCEGGIWEVGGELRARD